MKYSLEVLLCATYCKASYMQNWIAIENATSPPVEKALYFRNIEEKLLKRVVPKVIQVGEHWFEASFHVIR